MRLKRKYYSSNVILTPVKEVARLAGIGRNSQAIATALAKGKFEREVSVLDLPDGKADLILIEENASRDLTG